MNIVEDSSQTSQDLTSNNDLNYEDTNLMVKFGQDKANTQQAYDGYKRR